MSICVNAHCLMLEVLTNIALNALNTVQKIKAMSKILKIDKVHIRGVRLCMSKMSKMGKEHTHTFWLITSLILILKHVGDVGDRTSTPKGCNAIYVGDIRDRNNLQYTQCLYGWKALSLSFPKLFWD